MCKPLWKDDMQSLPCTVEESTCIIKGINYHDTN